MLPRGFDLRHLDDGIRNLVVNLNRIPDLHTMTTCEGHIWRETPAWPTKDGWIHFYKPIDKYSDLIEQMLSFCNQHNSFKLEGPTNNSPSLGNNFFTMVAMFESHENGNLFDRLDGKGKKEYFSKAEIRLRQNLSGWSELDKLVATYIRNHLKREPESLPYI